MKNKFIIFYTIFASAVFAFAIAFFGVNIYKEYSQGQSRANQRYNTLVTDIKSYNSIDKEISENSLSNLKSSFFGIRILHLHTIYITHSTDDIP